MAIKITDELNITGISNGDINVLYGLLDWEILVASFAMKTSKNLQIAPKNMDLRWFILAPMNGMNYVPA